MSTEILRPNKLIAVSVIVILITTLSPVNGKMLGSYLDKLAHFLLFLALSINICYRYFDSNWLNTALLLALLLAISTEVLQQFIPGRNMDLIDGLADSLGIIIGYFFYKKNLPQIDSPIKSLADLLEKDKK